MGEGLTAPKSDRLLSLDVFRGITIAGMILVNNPGSWGHMYAPLGHANWHGWTPTDLIFPFFLFMVGVAMTLSFDRRISRGQSRVRLLEQVVRRTIILFLLGLIMAGYPNWRLIAPFVLFIVGLGFVFADEPPLGLGQNTKATIRKFLGWAILLAAVLYFLIDFSYFQESRLRVPGVLQRIALCYFFAALIIMYTGIRGRIIWTLILLVGYWIIVKMVPAPGGYTANVLGPEGLLHDWLDVKLLGAHLYSSRPDPEGILSTLPAIATTLTGVLTGNWLKSSRDLPEKIGGLFVAANIALFVGICMDYWFPINKKIWTSSYVVFTSGMALHFLAMCFWMIDYKGYRAWTYPFRVFGTNAITVFFASGIMVRILTRQITFTLADGSTIAARTWLYQTFFASWASPVNASLLFAISYVLLWLLLMMPLYHKKIFIKI